MRVMLISLLLISWSVHAEPRLRPATWGVPVIGTGLTNLYKVADGVYRSAQPDEEDVADLQALGIKEILNLREFHKDDGEVEGGNFKLDRVRMNAGDVTEAQLIAALKKIKNRQGSILIHCWHGSDRTGTTVAAYRIVFEHWSKAQALDEMVHGGFGYHASFYPNLVELVKKLDVNRMRRELGLPEKPANTTH